jgi:hypothetical protein
LFHLVGIGGVSSLSSATLEWLLRSSTGLDVCTAFVLREEPLVTEAAIDVFPVVRVVPCAAFACWLAKTFLLVQSRSFRAYVVSLRYDGIKKPSRSAVAES